MPVLQLLVNFFPELHDVFLQLFYQARAKSANTSFLRRLIICYVMLKYNINTPSEINAKIKEDKLLSGMHSPFAAKKTVVKNCCKRLEDLHESLKLLDQNQWSCKDLMDTIEESMQDQARSGAPLKYDRCFLL